MDCSKCKDNYLLDIFNECLSKYKRTNEAIIKFDQICMRSGDPRSSILILKSINCNTCNECKKFKKYYRK